MAVASVSGAANATAAKPATAPTVDYNAFLKLLVAQARNQDPTNPTDSTAYLSQRASFSTVEQTLQMNKKLEQIAAASGLADANSLIGATVTTQDGLTGKVTAATLKDAAPHLVLSDGSLVPFADGLIIKR